MTGVLVALIALVALSALVEQGWNPPLRAWADSAGRADTARDSELLLHWPLLEADGMEAVDASSRGHHGALLRQGLRDRMPRILADAGRDGAALALEAGGIVASAPLALDEAWTLSFWMRDHDVGDEAGTPRFALSDLVALVRGERLMHGPWFYRTDPDEVGVAHGWHTAEPDAAWTQVPVSAFLSSTEVGLYHGYGWYRTDFLVEHADRLHELHFGAVDEQAWVYVNGERVGEHTVESEGAGPGAIWNRPFTIPIAPEHLRADEPNQLAVRTHAGGGQAGIVRPVTLRPADSEAVNLLAETGPLRGTRPTAGQWEHMALVVADERATLYINGVEAARQPWADARAGSFTQLQFRAGGEHGDVSLLLDVRLDDVRVYHDALSARAVADLAEGRFHPEAEWVRRIDPALRPLVERERWPRDQAERQIARFADVGAPNPDALVTSLADAPQPQARAEAAWALGVYQSTRAVEPLVEALGAEAPEVVSAAGEALRELLDEGVLHEAVGRMDEQQAARVLGELVREAPVASLGEAAADLLARRGDASAIEELRRALTVGPIRHRLFARRALREHGHDTSLADGPVVLKNPYSDVNWDEVNTYKANFHSHTIRSDGRAEPDHVIAMYADAGYDILAVTDHDNYHVHREGERRVEPTAETTWPWTRWIDQEPARVWERDGMETSAFYPGLGERGMLAVRGNELTQHPHIQSLFNDCGWLDRDRTDDERLQCVDNAGGLAYWAHPFQYLPRGDSAGRFGGWEGAVEHYGRLITTYEGNLGMEVQRSTREADLELFDRLLEAHYREHDVFVVGNDDNHGTSVSESAAISLVLAEALTEEAVRHALESGHKFAGHRTASLPRFHRIEVDEAANTISVDLDNYERIRWIKDGRVHAEGAVFDFANMEDAIVRFEVDQQDAVFLSQAFHIW